MQLYITRVELHKAVYSDYQTLHSGMEGKGFSRTIMSNKGLKHLPTAEYAIQSGLGKAVVLEKAETAASQTNLSYEIFVSEVNGWTCTGLADA